MDSTLLLEPNQQAQHLLNTRDCQNTTPTSSQVVIQPKAQNHKTHWNLPFYPLFFSSFPVQASCIFPFSYSSRICQLNPTQHKLKRDPEKTQRRKEMEIGYEEKDFLACCGSTKFAKEMALASPFASLEQAVTAATDIWFNKIDVTAWLQAFSAHPQIGDSNSSSSQSHNQTSTQFSFLIFNSSIIQFKLT